MPQDGSKPARGRERRDFRTTVKTVFRITPHMVRLVLTGPDLAGFSGLPWSDQYVKIMLPADGELPAVSRSYTIRSWNVQEREMTIDVVVHGSSGRVGPWAASAAPGDEVVLRGPGGSYLPKAEYDWHLLIGDESALPAIAAAIETLPSGARAVAFIEVVGVAEQQEFQTRGNLDVTWLHRDSTPGVYGAGLIRAVRDLAFELGRVQVFLHGEAGMVRELRRHLRRERMVPKSDMSVSGYWRLGRDDEAWRAEKSEWRAAVERDEQGLAAQD